MTTIDILKQQLNDILKSTIWRMTNFRRQLLQMLPYGIRTIIRSFLATTYRFIKRSMPQRVLGTNETKALMRVYGAQQPVEDVGIENSEYAFWVRQFDTLSGTDRRRIRNSIEKLTVTPLISVIVPVYETPEMILRRTIESVVAQVYPHWELCISDDASKAPHIRAVIDEYATKDRRIKWTQRSTNGHISAASNSALSLATGDYVALLDHGDLLSEHALYMVVDAIAANPTADIFYSDEDKLDVDGNRCDPYFKPHWNIELFFGQNYINHLTVYKRAIVDTVGGFRPGYEGSQNYDLALRAIAAKTGSVVHISHILYHQRIFSVDGTMSSARGNHAVMAARRALTDHFSEIGHVSIGDVVGRFHRVIRPDPTIWPTVSVVIPTRDHLDVLELVIYGLLEKTNYPNLDIIIADNDSIEPQTLAYFASDLDSRVTVLKCPGQFNYSAINNQAIAQSTGELVLLLNNDISMIEPQWLKEMTRYFSDSTVGAVGAKLLYPDGTLQHAGVVLGMGGVAGHRCINMRGHEPGHFGQLALAQDVSCVTGACLLIRRSIFNEIGGLDAQNLAVAFNDVDLCIRVGKAGYRIIWTPFAELYHHESRSRGSDLVGKKRARLNSEHEYMINRWGQTLTSDPFYNSNLSLQTTTPRLAFPPRQPLPWKRGNTGS